MRKRMITLAAAVVAATMALVLLAGCGKANPLDGTTWYEAASDGFWAFEYSDDTYEVYRGLVDDKGSREQWRAASESMELVRKESFSWEEDEGVGLVGFSGRLELTTDAAGRKILHNTLRNADYYTTVDEAIDAYFEENGIVEAPAQESTAQETASTAASNIDTSTYKMDGVVDYVRSSVKDWSDKYTQSDDLYEVILANEDVIAVVAGIGTCEYEGAQYPAFFLWSYSLNDDVKNLTIELTNLQKDGITMHDESVTIDKSCASGPFLNETNVIDSYDGVTGTITIKNADTGEVLGQGDFTI